MIPSRDVRLVSFLFFSRENPKVAQKLTFDDIVSIEKSDFDVNRKTKLVVHGYNDGPDTAWIANMKRAYLKRENCNIIVVDWSRLSGPSPFYWIAAKNAALVGNHVADFILFLKAFFRLDVANDLHVIGFSLGAQVVGKMGNRLRWPRVGRITGLDPAGLLFHNAPRSRKLTSDSAQFVDVIHTAGRWIGTDEPVTLKPLLILTYFKLIQISGRSRRLLSERRESASTRMSRSRKSRITLFSS